MADFVPPSGPPPPKVPEGWKAQWNEQYKEWFFVNIYTKKSQWEKPTEPVYPSNNDAAPPGAPPGYSGSSGFENVGDRKGNPFETPHNTMDEDARLAAQLQAEEDARAAATRSNATHDYANTPMPQSNSPMPQSNSPMPQYGQQPYGEQSYGQQPYGLQQQGAQLPPREEKKGLFSKILGAAAGKASHGGSHGYGGYPQQGYGGYPQQGYGGYAYSGYGPPKKSHGGGMGVGGAAALGVGGGLVGGMLLADAMDDHEYEQGYEAGQNDDGGDFGDGGDDGGGD